MSKRSSKAANCSEDDGGSSLPHGVGTRKGKVTALPEPSREVPEAQEVKMIVVFLLPANKFVKMAKVPKSPVYYSRYPMHPGRGSAPLSLELKEGRRLTVAGIQKAVARELPRDTQGAFESVQGWKLPQGYQMAQSAQSDDYVRLSSDEIQLKFGSSPSSAVVEARNLDEEEIWEHAARWDPNESKFLGDDE